MEEMMRMKVLKKTMYTETWKFLYRVVLYIFDATRRGVNPEWRG